ncbi:MAG TPA: hypothetical protein VEA38_14225 [Terriglobales bacterium]|nr:hypothetical protein [Terriglobales bacterium]
MTADHWGFVAAAYVVAALALGGYWRRLVHLEKTLKTPTLRSARRRSAAR